MPSLLDKITELWPEKGPLSTAAGQRAVLGVATVVIGCVPLVVGREPHVAAAYTVLVALLVVVGGLYIQRGEQQIWGHMRDLLIMAVLVVGVVYATWAYAALAPEAPVFAMPATLGAVLATVLLNSRAGVLVAMVAVGVGVLFGVLDGVHVVGMLLTSGAAVSAMASMRDRTRLIWSGGVLVGVTALAAAGATLAENGSLDGALRAAGLGALGAVGTVVLALGLLPLFEAVFGVTTDVRLLELASPSAPLLKRLMMEAPGTYSHSVITGNLAESAAEAIDANPLLARVGAYYHDVGKIKRPAFFVENQAGCSNPHDNTSPSMSALIITAHVREGVQLAEEYRLPPEVIDIVRQHHGTSMVSYFYHKAAACGGPVYEADFRYSGELPRTREAAIVMLADSCEAAVRACSKPTPVRIEDVVRKVVSAKLNDHQLDQADLTFAEIETVINVYTRMLASVYHPRIEYPEVIAGRNRNAG
ncbi:MAG: HDIG domain-containing protein [Actinomycetia bacterium]|nr:HDIG domain-containing protein [Actinomycetes bacterium]